MIVEQPTFVFVNSSKPGPKVDEWSDNEIDTLRTMWFDYKNDTEIGEAISRSSKAVQAKRRVLGLQSKYHPERPNMRGYRGDGARSYSKAENEDILSRYDSGEPTASIAASYCVTSRAINNKIDRMLLKREIANHAPQMSPTKRKCLSCQKDFLSIRPRSEHRRCNACHILLLDNGNSFLTVYDPST